MDDEVKFEAWPQAFYKGSEVRVFASAEEVEAGWLSASEVEELPPLAEDGKLTAPVKAKAAPAPKK